MESRSEPVTHPVTPPWHFYQMCLNSRDLTRKLMAHKGKYCFDVYLLCVFSRVKFYIFLYNVDTLEQLLTDTIYA